VKVLGKVTNEMIESISREMIERKLAEELLRQSEGKYRLLIENMPDAIWMAGQKGDVIFISSNIEKMCGYTSKEICESGGALWFGRIHVEDIEYVKEAFVIE
jgi:two-component system CheB/CheR fusion protein